MSEHECYQLLDTQRLGRIGVLVDDFPLIIPVNFALDGHTVVIRSRPGTKLTYADGAKVTFEVDDVDRITRTGWSVLVRGRANVLGREDEGGLAERTRLTPASPWAPGDFGFWLRITPGLISGRRIARTADFWD